MVLAIILIPWGTPKLIILVHDVSPVYYPYIENITALIEEYGFQNSTILLIIPNHAGKHPISKDERFVQLIKKLEEEGYKVGIHGYDHIGNEFLCNETIAEAKLRAAREELERAGIKYDKVFVPPRYEISTQALKVLLRNNFTVFLKGKVCYPSGDCERIKEREYTWYAGRLRAKIMLVIAKFEFTHTRGIFVLSIHPKAVNYGGGMDFLREFLKYAKEKEK